MMNTKRHNVTTTPENSTQTTDQSITTMRYQVSWTNNMVLVIEEICGLGNESVISHQRLVYTKK